MNKYKSQPNEVNSILTLKIKNSAVHFGYVRNDLIYDDYEEISSDELIILMKSLIIDGYSYSRE